MIVIVAGLISGASAIEISTPLIKILSPLFLVNSPISLWASKYLLSLPRKVTPFLLYSVAVIGVTLPSEAQEFTKMMCSKVFIPRKNRHLLTQDTSAFKSSILIALVSHCLPFECLYL